MSTSDYMGGGGGREKENNCSLNLKTKDVFYTCHIVIMSTY